MNAVLLVFLFPLRKMLILHRKYGVLSCVLWIIVSTAVLLIFVGVAQYIELVFWKTEALPFEIVATILWLPLIPTFWASGILLIERLWMFSGVYRLLGVRQHYLRDLFGRWANVDNEETN